MRTDGYNADYRDSYMERVRAGQDRADRAKESSGRQGQADKMKAGEEHQRADLVTETDKMRNGQDREKGFPVLKDEYIESKKSGRKVRGLYRLGQDEIGNPKVLYDEPEKGTKGRDVRQEEPAKRSDMRQAEEPAKRRDMRQAEEPAKEKDVRQGEEAAKKTEECRGSTDQVDREIERLREKKRQLRQQIEAAGGDEEKVKELERKLSQVEAELNRKDNDTYRRQNMTVS